MEDVLEVYARPYDAKCPVVCLDEKSKELHATPRGSLAMQPKAKAGVRGHAKAGVRGHAQRVDSEYERHGTANLFCGVEPLTGRCAVRVTRRRTGLDFAEQLRLLVEEDYPHAERIVLVTDNLNTHSPACLYERFSPEQARRIAQKIEWHYTPEHGSWLNMAELELSILGRQCLKRRLPERETLVREVAAWEQTRNATPVQIRWQFTTEDARIKLRRLYPVVKVQRST
jgi:transposase